ncbi:ribonuclease III domain-containing protein [Xylariaceae sp. FL0804]|nr:ribonuclease III domain-containing protein [Xylariaceae sp. FL0804]
MDKDIKISNAENICGRIWARLDLLWEALQAPGSGIGVLNGRQLGSRGNEPLAGVGNRFLSLVATEISYDRNEAAGETNAVITGSLNNKRLARICDTSGLTASINQDRSSQGQLGIRAQASTVEAVVGAAYLDGGYEEARVVIRNLNILE